MQTADILQTAKQLGVDLEADHGALIAKPASRLTADLRVAIRSHKADLLIALIAGHHGLTAADLREAAGHDWPEVERDPALLETLAHAVSIRRMRERGEVPPSYTATTVCAGCGPVPIFPGVSGRVDGCLWCFNRIRGLPVPRVATLVGAEVGDPYASELLRRRPEET